MNIKESLLLIFFATATLQTANAQTPFTIQLSSANVRLECIKNKNDSLLFFNLHNNEKTSITAVKTVLKTKPGKYLGILSGGTRELTIKHKGKTIRFDPNRIFSKAGIKKTLIHYGCYSETNLKLVDALAQEIITHLAGAKLIVAMHNNTGKGYSIATISAANKNTHEAKEIYINPHKDKNDFYYVTEKSKFDYFKSQGYNVVLQDNTNVIDDGSLSVYCGKHNISYINIECQNGHLKQQIEMVEMVYQEIRKSLGH